MNNESETNNVVEINTTSETNEVKNEEIVEKESFFKKHKNILWVLLLVVLIPSFTVVGFIVGNNLNLGGNSSIGDYEVLDNPQDNENDDTVAREKGEITFAGYGKYQISSKKPNIEIKNPSGNFVDMIFILTDEATGEIIARTKKVQSGKFVYVNIMNFYKKTGNYTIILNTLTYDSKTGEQMNGMNQKIDISI